MASSMTLLGCGASGGGGLASLPYSDTFGGTATLLLHTPDFGNRWTNPGGGGSGQCNNGSTTGGGLYVMPTPAANVTMQITVAYTSPATDGNNSGFVLRLTDATHRFLCIFTPDSATPLQILKNSGAGDVTLASSAGSPNPSPVSDGSVTMSFSGSGSTLTASATDGDGNTYSCNAIDSFNLTATKHGILLSDSLSGWSLTSP